MKPVMQHPFPNACSHAVLAMICGTDLETAIRITGTTEFPDHEAKMRLLRQFGFKGEMRIVITEGMGANCLAALMRENKYLYGLVSSCLDP
jgi:hypothetical protein